MLDIISNKPIVLILLVLLIGSSGIGATNFYASSENNNTALEIENKLHKHVINEDSHPITSYKIESILEKIDILTKENQSLKHSIDKLTMIICTNNGYDCDL